MHRNQPEAHLVLQILQLLRLKGLIAGKVKVKGGIGKNGGFFNDPYLMKGLPDIIAFRPNSDTMYAIEAKIAPNKQTPEQISFQKLFHYPPSRIYILAYSAEDTIRVIDYYQKNI